MLTPAQLHIIYGSIPRAHSIPAQDPCSLDSSTSSPSLSSILGSKYEDPRYISHWHNSTLRSNRSIFSSYSLAMARYVWFGYVCFRISDRKGRRYLFSEAGVWNRDGGKLALDSDILGTGLIEDSDCRIEGYLAPRESDKGAGGGQGCDLATGGIGRKAPNLLVLIAREVCLNSQTLGLLVNWESIL